MKTRTACVWHCHLAVLLVAEGTTPVVLCYFKKLFTTFTIIFVKQKYQENLLFRRTIVYLVVIMDASRFTKFKQLRDITTFTYRKVNNIANNMIR